MKNLLALALLLLLPLGASAFDGTSFSGNPAGNGSGVVPPVGPWLLLDTSNDPLTGDLVTGTLAAPHDNTIHGGFPNGSGRENDPAFNVEGFVDINGQYSDPAANKPLLEITANQTFTDTAYIAQRSIVTFSGNDHNFMELQHFSALLAPTGGNTENTTYKAQLDLSITGVEDGSVHTISAFEAVIVTPHEDGTCNVASADQCYYYGLSTPAAEVAGATGYILKDTFHTTAGNNVGVLDHLFRFGTPVGVTFDAGDHLVDFSVNNVDLAYITADGGGYFSGDTTITGKLTVTGVIDPTALILSGGTDLYLESADGSTAAAAGIGSNKGRIRYLNGTGWQVSANDGVWSTISTGGGGSAFVQGGNSFGALATLGTNDTFGLSLETDGTSRLNILSTGEIIAGGPTVTAFPALSTQFSVVQPTAGLPALFGARTAGGPSAFFGVSSNGTVTAPTASAPGDILLLLASSGYGSDDVLDTGGAANIVYLVNGVAPGSVGADLIFLTKTSADASPLPRMYIKGDGFVGVNTAMAYGTETFAVTGDAYVTGKLTVLGVIDPTALVLSGSTDLYLESADGSTAAPAGVGSNKGRLRYLNGTGWQASANDGVWTTLSTGGGTVTGLGAAGQAAFWTGASAIGGSTQFLWDNTTGLAVTGAPVNLNASSNFAVNVGTGTTTATVSVGGGSNSVSVNSSAWDITALGGASGFTGLSSSGTITFSGLTASRAIFTDASSNLAASGASAALLNALTDETGTGVAVFGTSPTITTSLVSGSTSFDLLNTGITTGALNMGGSVTSGSINVGAAGLTGNLTLGGGTAGGSGCTMDGTTGNFACSGTISGSGTITAVGSMTSGAVFANASASGNWLGLGAAAGRMDFTDDTTDVIGLRSANVHIGVSDGDVTATGYNLAVSQNAGNASMAAFTFSSTPTHRDIIAFERARGTAASPTALSAGDIVGEFVWNTYTNSRQESAKIRVDAAAGFGSSGADAPANMTFYTTPDGSGTAIARLTILADGNVGIGDETPVGLLTVGASDAFQVDTSGNITTAGDVAINGGDITSILDSFNLLTTQDELHIADAVPEVGPQAIYLGRSSSDEGNLYVFGNSGVGCQFSAVDAGGFAGQETSLLCSGNLKASRQLNLTAKTLTGLTATTEYSDMFLDVSNTKTFATGAITTERAIRISNPTYAFSGASTITNAATMAIAGAPVAGTNATITNSYALWVQAGNTQLEGGLAVNGGDLTTSVTTFNLLNTNATTVNFGGAATTMSIGASGGTVSFPGDVSINGQDLTSTGTQIRFGKVTRLAQSIAAAPGAPGGSTCAATGDEGNEFYLRDTTSGTNAGGKCVCAWDGSAFGWTAGVPAPSTSCP